MDRIGNPLHYKHIQLFVTRTSPPFVINEPYEDCLECKLECYFHTEMIGNHYGNSDFDWIISEPNCEGVMMVFSNHKTKGTRSRYNEAIIDIPDILKGYHSNWVETTMYRVTERIFLATWKSAKNYVNALSWTPLMYLMGYICERFQCHYLVDFITIFTFVICQQQKKWAKKFCELKTIIRINRFLLLHSKSTNYRDGISYLVRGYVL